jgi:hypothetical protein
MSDQVPICFVIIKLVASKTNACFLFFRRYTVYVCYLLARIVARSSFVVNLLSCPCCPGTKQEKVLPGSLIACAEEHKEFERRDLKPCGGLICHFGSGIWRSRQMTSARFTRKR